MIELKRIGIIKRASAFLLDIILLVVLATGFIFLVSLICNYSEEEALAIQYYEEWEDFRKQCVPHVAEVYGFEYAETDAGYEITKDGKAATLEDVIAALEESEGNDPETATEYGQYQNLTPASKVNVQYRYVYTLLFTMSSVGILLAYLVLEFIIPLILKNGQTIGKKIFGICLVRSNTVKISTVQLFARTFLGKFAIETMFPVLLVFLFLFGGIGALALILVAALLLLNAIVFLATRNKTPIHDIFADTVAVDMNLQVICKSEEELIEKKTLQNLKSV